MKTSVVKKVSLSSLIVLLIAVLAFKSQNVEGANILGLFTSHSPSHLIVHMSVARALAERGHNVTVVSGLIPKITHPNITHIVIPPNAEQEALLNDHVIKISEQENSFVNLIKLLVNTMSLMMELQYDVVLDKRFTELYDQHFDVVILGSFFNDFLLGVADKLKAPVILDWTSSPIDYVHQMIGNPFEWAYVPNSNIGIKRGELMTFGQRIKNFVSGIMFKGLTIILEHKFNGLHTELFKNDNVLPYNEIKKNVSLIFTSSHFSEGPIRPNVPALVEIGGIQVKDKPDPLPKKIAEHLNAATQHGAILFCLGSNVKSSNIKPESMAIIFKVLSGLKQNVIWKWDDLDNLPGKSDNILYIKWLPQDDILAHPNLKLFITHAGKGGITEAQYHGVPMLALPIFGDQTGNAEAMVASGYGVQLNMRQLTEADFKHAVTEVLTNSTYRNNVGSFSKLYRDRPLTAKQSVVYWTEYVMRHHGASHMQSPLVHMNGYQAANLDVIAVILGVLLIFIVVVKITTKFIFILIRKYLCKPKKTYIKMKTQ